MSEEKEPLLSWTYYAGATDSVPPSKVYPKRSNTPPELLDIDKLIEESTGLYQQWWILFKKNHPDRCLIRKEEPVIKPPPKPKVTFKPLSCKRCNHTWTPRSKEPPVQCPKCHSPYWNRDRVKRN